MTETKMTCQVTSCDYRANFDGSARQQWDEMQEHLNTEHFKGRGNGMSNASFEVQLQQNFGNYLKAMWDQLDDYIVTAMEWTGPASEEMIAGFSHTVWLEDKVKKTAQSAGGRGMAEAIQIMCEGDFASSDDVIGMAVERYTQRVKGLDGPVPPGLGFTQTTSAPAPGVVEMKPETAAPAPVTAPVATETGPVVDEEIITGIKNAVAAGLSKEMLAATYDMTVQEIDQVLAA